jgi:hypothetical protein
MTSGEAMELHTQLDLAEALSRDALHSGDSRMLFLASITLTILAASFAGAAIRARDEETKPPTEDTEA